MTTTYNFEWDPKKERSNRKAHGVGFDEGSTVFTDPSALSIFDPDHSGSEDRWLTMGVSSTGRLVVVSHTFRRETEDVVTIRIISVRKASKLESQTYGEKA
ncbi:MAG: BrnT family toxin [Desulfobacterales bacterium]|nr:BrnT family toxin [Desulfobacterales bacterium]